LPDWGVGGDPRHPPKGIVPDLDDTVHWSQKISAFNAHHDERCFLPIHTQEVETGHCATIILRPGKTRDGKEVYSHRRRLVRRIRMEWPTRLGR